MENFQFNLSTKYYFGQNEHKNVGKILAEHKDKFGIQKILLVYGQGSVKRSGLLDDIKGQLSEFNFPYVELSDIQPNPTATKVYEGIKLCKEEKVDFILALGGGSVIDTAKAISLGAVDDGDFFDFFLKKRKPCISLKVASVLTIAAAGSESSPSCVIQKQVGDKVIKTGCTTELNKPVIAILDPTLTYTLSNYQTACGVVDMMAHIMERYFTNTEGCDITDRMCESLLKSIIHNAHLVFEDPFNYDARANLMWAGALAHNNICGVGREQDWASHHLEHQLSALHDIAHGAGLSVIFPAWMEYVYNHDVKRFCQFANRVFDININLEDLEKTAQLGIRALREFFKSIDMPLSFKDINASKNDIPKLVEMLGVDEMEKSEGHFVQLYRQDCEKIYLIAAEYDCKKDNL